MASFNIVAEEITFFIFPLCPPPTTSSRWHSSRFLGVHPRVSFSVSLALCSHEPHFLALPPLPRTSSGLFFLRWQIFRFTIKYLNIHLRAEDERARVKIRSKTKICERDAKREYFLKTIHKNASYLRLLIEELTFGMGSTLTTALDSRRRLAKEKSMNF